MGKRGPKKTPTKVLEKRGSWRAKERSGEPQVPGDEKVMPDPPKYLCKEAVEKWNELGPILTAMETLTVADIDLFAKYCETWVRWKDAILFLRENGETMKVYSKKNETTTEQLRPESNLSIKLGDQLGRMQSKLGMSAADRAGIKVPGGRKIKKDTRGRKKKANVLEFKTA